MFPIAYVFHYKLSLSTVRISRHLNTSLLLPRGAHPNCFLRKLYEHYPTTLYLLKEFGPLNVSIGCPIKLMQFLVLLVFFSLNIEDFKQLTDHQITAITTQP